MSYLSQHSDISSIAMKKPQQGHLWFLFCSVDSAGLANLTAD